MGPGSGAALPAVPEPKNLIMLVLAAMTLFVYSRVPI